LFVYLLGGDKKENFEKYKQKFINMKLPRFIGQIVKQHL